MIAIIPLVVLAVCVQGLPASELDAAILARYQAAAAYSEARSGASMLVCEGGRVVFEAYAEGVDADTPHPLASGTKSFWGVLAIAACEDELFTLEEKVADTIHEWKGDPLREQITIRQLLNLSSGLPSGKSRVNMSRDKYRTAIEIEAERKAGEAFEYGPASYYCFGELLRRKLEPRELDPLEYLRERVLDPIGLEVASWRHDGVGHPLLPNGASLTAREWAKFGAFILNGGRSGDRQLISKEGLATCFEPSAANPSYGLTFWLGADAEQSLVLGMIENERRRARLRKALEARRAGRGANIPAELWMAAGKGKQRMYLLPTLDLVIVRQGASGHEWSDLDFLELLLPPAPEPASEAEAR